MVGVILQAFEAESLISPILSEVAVHGVVLSKTISQHLTSVIGFTICISDIGPIDLIRMFTFTSVGLPKD